MSGSAQYREFQPDHAVIYSASFVLPSLSLSDVGTQLHYLSHFGVPTEGFTAQPAFQASYEIDLLGRKRAQAEAAAKKYVRGASARDAAMLSVRQRRRPDMLHCWRLTTGATCCRLP